MRNFCHLAGAKCFVFQNWDNLEEWEIGHSSQHLRLVGKEQALHLKEKFLYKQQTAFAHTENDSLSPVPLRPTGIVQLDFTYANPTLELKGTNSVYKETQQ